MVLPLILGAVGALATASAANKATNAQTAAARNDLALREKIYDETSANFDPYREFGQDGMNALAYELGLGEVPEGYAGFQQSPGYQFQFDEGMRALEGSAAANGNLRSGATMKALQQYGQGVANQEHGNYLNRLFNVTGIGQAAAGNQAAAGQNYAAGASQAYGNIGNAQAAGAVATGNAINSGIGNVLGAYQTQQVMGNSPSFNALGGAEWWTGGNGW